MKQTQGSTAKDNGNKLQFIPDCPISKLIPYQRNPRLNDAAVKAVSESIGRFGAVAPIIVDKDFNIAVGHTRYKAALQRGKSTFPVLVVPHLTGDEFTAYNIADNQTASIAEWDMPELAAIIKELEATEFPVDVLGFDDAQLQNILNSMNGDLSSNNIEHKSLVQCFGVPPFSVFDSRQGYWQTRKREWLSLGIQSEIGRGMCRPHGKDTRPVGKSGMGKYNGGDCWKTSARCYGQDLMKGENKNFRRQAEAGNLRDAGTAQRKYSNGNIGGEWSGTSIFDPVLCEIMYRWFCPVNGIVLDPFAGGSVRGIVASECGLQYVGIDLSRNQVEANRLQATTICKRDGCPHPIWFVGDANDITDAWPRRESVDFVFSCPPYFDLEHYSDDRRDLSNMNWDEFVNSYHHIINAACSRLKENSFACFVVGDIRDKAGFYRNFVSKTITGFEQAGMTLYNEAILINVLGSLPIRIGKQFSAARKLGKCHQNVLIFFNGDPNQIRNIDYPDTLWQDLIPNAMPEQVEVGI